MTNDLPQMTLQDAITRLKILDNIVNNNYSEAIYMAIKAIEQQPKIGKWIFHEPFDNGRKNCNECIECSQCHTWLGHDCYVKTPYCPMCGAKMVEPQESEDKG